jgi:2-isopropylmalate synthase
MTLQSQQTVPTSRDERELVAVLKRTDGSTLTIEGNGNGPIDAFVDALKRAFNVDFSFLDYHEHAVGRGANATAATYVELQDGKAEIVHGVGMDPNIVMASLKAVLSAVLRLLAREGRAV